MRQAVVGSLTGAFANFRAKARGDDAAALTYFGVLALGPFLVAIVAAVGLFGREPQTSDAILRWIGEIGPASATDTFRGTIETLVRDKRSAGTLFGVGVAGALWTTSGWLDSFCRVVNDVHGVTDDRGFITRKAGQLVATFAVGLGIVIIALLVVVSGPIASRLAEAVGASNLSLAIWAAVQWPLAAGLAVVLLAALFRFALAREHPSWTTSLIGAAVAVATWAGASIGFGVYVTQFGSYNATYGALGAVVVFLVWLWVTHAAFIFGATVDAELLRRQRRSSTPITTCRHGAPDVSVDLFDDASGS